MTPRLCCFGLNPALSMFSSLTGLVHVQTMGTLHVRNTVFHPDKHPPNFRYGNQAVLTVAHLETSKGHFSHTFYIAKIDNADTMCKIEKFVQQARRHATGDVLYAPCSRSRAAKFAVMGPFRCGQIRSRGGARAQDRVNWDHLSTF